MKTLRRFYDQNVEQQFLSLLGRDKKRRLTGYIQTSLLRTGNDVSVSIALYCLPRDSAKGGPRADRCRAACRAIYDRSAEADRQSANESALHGRARSARVIALAVPPSDSC